MQIPFIDLQRQYESIKTEIDQAIAETVRGFQFIRGEKVSEFENKFAGALGVKHCIATGNGTDSLFIALKVSGIGLHCEVITPAFSWISTAETISLCGAKP